MDYKDYYKTLGVSKDATPEEIKRAYRKLAVKYHPDKNKGDRTAEDRFKEVNEANDVLSDPEKRKKYDRFGEDWQHYQESGAREGTFDWSKYTNRPPGGSQHGASDFGDIFGGEGAGDFFEMLFGNAFGTRSGRRSHAGTRGRDVSAELEITLDEAYHGASRQFEINGQTLRISLQPGIEDQQVLRLSGKGQPGRSNGASGDLFITVHVLPHPHLVREGNNLRADISVPLLTMVLGGKVEVQTPKGKVKIDVPPLTPNGKSLRLAGLGMPVYGSPASFGDMFVTLAAEIPKHLSEKQKALYRQLAELGS